MFRVSGFIFLLQSALLVVSLASSGSDLLQAKLPETQQKAAHVPETVLVQAVKDAVRENRVLAAQITAEGVRRAIDCSAAEAVLRAVLRGLVPEPSAKEFLAIARAAVHAAPADEGTTLNQYGQNVLTRRCSESLLVAAVSEYPRFAWILSESGKQVEVKQVEGKQIADPASPEQNLGPLLDPSLLPPAVLYPPTSGGLVSPTTP
jgi:methionyl-tRNA formyltransferase